MWWEMMLSLSTPRNCNVPARCFCDLWASHSGMKQAERTWQAFSQRLEKKNFVIASVTLEIVQLYYWFAEDFYWQKVILSIFHLSVLASFKSLYTTQSKDDICYLLYGYSQFPKYRGFAQCVLVSNILRYICSETSSSIYDGVFIKNRLGFKKEVVIFPGKGQWGLHIHLLCDIRMWFSFYLKITNRNCTFSHASHWPSLQDILLMSDPNLPLAHTNLLLSCWFVTVNYWHQQSFVRKLR